MTTKLVPIYKPAPIINQGTGIEQVDTSTIEKPKYLGSDGKHPYDKSNSIVRFWQQMTHSWQSPLFSLGNKEAIQPYHVWEIPQKDSVNELEKEWDAIVAKLKEKKRKERKQNDKKNDKNNNKNNCENSKIRLYDILWEMEGRQMKISFFGGCFAIFSSLVVPLIISYLTDYFESDETGMIFEGTLLSVLLIFATLLRTFGLSYTWTRMIITITRIRSILKYIIYRKSLSLSTMINSGKKMNLISHDSDIVAMAFGNISLMIPHLIFILLVIIAMIYVIGVSALAGCLFIILVSGPIQMRIGKSIAKAKKAFLKASDSRVKFINELIQGIRITKLYAWEVPLMDKVQMFRKQELAQVFERIKYMSCHFMLSVLIPQCMALIIFATYIGLGNELTVSRVFTVIAMIALMRVSVRILPQLVSMISECQVGLNRIDEYLQLDEKDDDYMNDSNNNNNSSDSDNERIAGTSENNTHIMIENATFYWNSIDSGESKTSNDDTVKSATSEKKEDNAGNTEQKNVESYLTLEMNDSETEINDNNNNNEFGLRNVNLEITRGKLVALVGSVGSGKSALINAILGEMSLVSGKCHVYENNEVTTNNCLNKCTIGYVNQTPFIMNTTLKENVLFGLPYDEEKYNECIQASALIPDLNLLANGDMTTIGEKGINLSGGQKARVSFGRALYRGHCNVTDLFLLDDPLSAVDINVGNIMFHKGICKILENKTRIVVMNSHLHLLKYFDIVIIMDKGKIAAQTTYENVMQNEDYSHLLPSEMQHNLKKQATIMMDDLENENSDNKSKAEEEVLIDKSKTALMKEEKEKEKKGKLTIAEDRNKGQIGFGIIAEYFGNAARNEFDFRQVSSNINEEKSLKGTMLIVMVSIILIFLQCLQTGSDVWLTLFSEESSKNRFPGKSNGWWLIIWTIIVASIAVVALGSSVLFGYINIKASMNLHIKILYSVLRASILYFDATPVGRIVNRFSKDVSIIDQQLPPSTLTFINAVLSMISFVIIICVTVPYVFVILVFAVVAVYYLQKFYRTTSRELKRIENISRSPIYIQFGESLDGLFVIRAYQLIDLFKQSMKLFIDHNSKIYLQQRLSARWFNVRLEFIVSILVGFTSLFGVILKETNTETVSTALIILSIVYSYSCASILNTTMRVMVDVENAFTAVERLVHYLKIMKSDNNNKKEIMKSEAPEINFNYRPSSKDWPDNGNIEFKNLKLRYRSDLDLVLKGLNVNISSNEKIGICGRSGAGKSSVFVSLFRLIEPENDSQLIIDNIDCLKLGLRDLRSSLSIIPQNPVLFSGTVRFNLDPFGSYNDDEIWNVLKQVNLDETIKVEKNSDLNCIVHENGSNFSQGQRQLLCFARALLKNGKILLLDEATSSIDKHSDFLIQKLIREKFNNKTVLCIAHRLETIMDYDKIMVLDNGTIAEFDSPENLMKLENGIFASMVNAAASNDKTDDATLTIQASSAV